MKFDHIEILGLYRAAKSASGVHLPAAFRIINQIESLPEFSRIGKRTISIKAASDIDINLKETDPKKIWEWFKAIILIPDMKAGDLEDLGTWADKLGMKEEYAKLYADFAKEEEKE